MSRSAKLLVLCALLGAGAAHAADKFSGIGRTATPKEIAAWDIDVRPDFAGLPKGRGTVAQGMAVWDGRCASCHGTFGESNEVFTPIIGGTTAEDMKAGHVTTLRNDRQPQRTTMMKLSTLSTLWDYINRAMPWNAPKSLTTDEVYAVTAYILNMAEVLPDDFTLSNDNIAEVQKRLPNRDGMSFKHGMRLPGGAPDVRNSACMKDCAGGKVTSSLPDYARNAHGNNAEQNRIVGPVRGADTTKPAPAGPLRQPPVAMLAPAPAEAPGASMAKKHGCVACHAVDATVYGPSWNAIRARYAGSDALAALEAKLRRGGGGTWGSLPMPAQAQVPAAELQEVLRWVLEAPATATK